MTPRFVAWVIGPVTELGIQEMQGGQGRGETLNPFLGVLGSGCSWGTQGRRYKGGRHKAAGVCEILTFSGCM